MLIVFLFPAELKQNSSVFRPRYPTSIAGKCKPKSTSSKYTSVDGMLNVMRTRHAVVSDEDDNAEEGAEQNFRRV